MDSDYNGVCEHFACGNELDIAKSVETKLTHLDGSKGIRCL